MFTHGELSFIGPTETSALLGWWGGGDNDHGMRADTDVEGRREA